MSSALSVGTAASASAAAAAENRLRSAAPTAASEADEEEDAAAAADASEEKAAEADEECEASATRRERRCAVCRSAWRSRRGAEDDAEAPRTVVAKRRECVACAGRRVAASRRRINWALCRSIFAGGGWLAARPCEAVARTRRDVVEDVVGAPIAGGASAVSRTPLAPPTAPARM
jgi:hypothetical protein